MPFLQLIAKKAMPIGGNVRGENEIGNAHGHENVSIIQGTYVRAGGEELVIPPLGSKCSAKHTIRRGERVYDLGLKDRGVGHSYVYKDHLFTIPTQEGFIHSVATNIYITDAVITDQATGVVVYQKD